MSINRVVRQYDETRQHNSQNHRRTVAYRERERESERERRVLTLNNKTAMAIARLWVGFIYVGNDRDHRRILREQLKQWSDGFVFDPFIRCVRDCRLRA